MNIKIPFLGDGIESANVVSILVSPGDKVDKDQTLIELETDKATAPVPATVSGTIDKVLVKEGDIVKEGMPVVSLEGSQDSTKTAPAEDAPKQAEKIAPTISQPTPVAAPIPRTTYESTNTEVHAAPSIKQFAALSGLDLGRVSGSGHGARITWEDIQSYVAYLQSTAFNSSVIPTQESTKPVKPSIDFSKFGPIERKPITSLRQKIANHLSNAWNEIPHVTQFADIPIDHIMALRKKENANLKKQDVKLTVTIYIMKAIAKTLAEFPNFNASLDNKELILKQYYHLGVAVDTDAGLVVPVIKDVDKKSFQDIAKELDTLAEKARNKALAVEDIQGATFTLSNLGGLGASHFTPIVNAPEVAILGTGRAQFKPVIDPKTKEISNILSMPVALSYDHRVIDGADGARFMQKLTDSIQNFDEKWGN